jgi:hypothetical protein
MESKGPGWIDAKKMAHGGSYNAAVGHDKNTSKVFCQQVVAPATDLFIESGYEITAGKLKMMLLLNPLTQLAGKAFFYLGKGQPLPLAKVDLLQIIVNDAGAGNLKEFKRLATA